MSNNKSSQKIDYVIKYQYDIIHSLEQQLKREREEYIDNLYEKIKEINELKIIIKKLNSNFEVPTLNDK